MYTFQFLIYSFILPRQVFPCCLTFVISVFQPALSLPLDKRAQRLSALQATALALQTRLKSQALRLGAVSEHAVSEPVSRVEVQTIKEETGFQGILPG